MKNKKKTEMTLEDKRFFENLSKTFNSAEEKEFFDKMKYKIEFEPAIANDLIMSEYDNEDGIYIVRCYDYEFIIGCHIGDIFHEEVF